MMGGDRRTEKITIDVDPDLLRRVGTTFDASESAEESTKKCKAFAELALRHFSDWVTGTKRYRSLTEQYIDWVESIYTELLPASERPTPERLYNSFNMPHGQATYVSRVLRDKALPRWRRMALVEIVERLEEQKPTAEEKDKDRFKREQGLPIMISKLALVELKRISMRMRAADESFRLPQTKAGGFGDFQRVEVPAPTVLALLKDPELKGAKTSGDGEH